MYTRDRLNSTISRLADPVLYPSANKFRRYMDRWDMRRDFDAKVPGKCRCCTREFVLPRLALGMLPSLGFPSPMYSEVEQILQMGYGRALVKAHAQTDRFPEGLLPD